MARPQLISRYRKVDDISSRDILAMHELFAEYYENADMDTFVRDLSRKDGAVLVYEADGGPLRGFTTMKTMPLPEVGPTAIGVFSGDTILHESHWGDPALQNGVARFMTRLKFSNLNSRVYWLLISKGYKTYLLMAKNFPHYYPRYDEPNDPDLEAIAERYAKSIFPDYYDESRRVLDFGHRYQRLRGEVAPITSQDRLREPAIRYFERLNPEWTRGVELPCVAEISLDMLIPYMEKQQRKLAERGGDRLRRLMLKQLTNTVKLLMPTVMNLVDDDTRGLTSEEVPYAEAEEEVIRPSRISAIAELLFGSNEANDFDEAQPDIARMMGADVQLPPNPRVPDISELTGLPVLAEPGR